MKIGFIGIGKLGKDVSEVISEKHEIVGYDVEKVNTSINMVDTIQETVHEKDIVFCAVPTPHHPNYDGKFPTRGLAPKNFNYDIVISSLTEINKYINKNTLVVLISTTLPGTVRDLLAKKITKGRFIYNPYLIAQTTVKWDMKNPEMIIIGTENGVVDQDVVLLKNFYRDICEIEPRFEIGTWEEAESIKIFYNTFITAKLCLVNMIQDTSMKIGNMNVDVVTDALKNSTKRIMGPSYMKAGLGDGGGCHPRDNIALRWLSKKYNFGYDLFDAIVNTREVQSKNIANFMIEKSNSDNFVILGTGFKPGTDQEEGSPSILVGYYLEQKRKNVVYTNSIDNIEKENNPHTYLIGHFGGYFNQYNFNKNSVIIDPWRELKVDNREDLTIYHYGNSRDQKK